MIEVLLKAIIHQLNTYLVSVVPPTYQSQDDQVKLGNIASSKFAGGSDELLNKKLVVSLVNIEEESSLRNKTGGKFENGQFLAMPPVVYLNLHLLFTANFDTYEIAIHYLFRVVEFFQGNRIFSFQNSPIAGLDEPTLQQVEALQLTAELNSLSFEQINDLWGSLGGKQMPFVLYRFRLVPVQMEKITGRDGIITETHLSLSH
jgi:Pvc16 N-terminal domain